MNEKNLIFPSASEVPNSSWREVWTTEEKNLLAVQENAIESYCVYTSERNYFNSLPWALYNIVKLLVLYCILYETDALIFLLNVCINIFTLHLITLLLKCFHLLLSSSKTWSIHLRRVTELTPFHFFFLCWRQQPVCPTWEWLEEAQRSMVT